MPELPADRLRRLNGAPLRTDGDYVLYWMTAHRRLSWNFALQRAVACSRELGRPLVILEALRCDYPHASARLHRFIVDGMARHRRRLARSPVLYHPYVEPTRGAGKGLLLALARSACLVVTDDYPTFFIPQMLRAAGAALPVRLEAVDANGILPLRRPGRSFATAHAFRRYLQRALPTALAEMPLAHPLRGARLPRLAGLPPAISTRWPAASANLLGWRGPEPDKLPVDHGVGPCGPRGGEAPARERWQQFLEHQLHRYADGRNDVDREVTSRLSPYLHFGHISSHQLVHELLARHGWSMELLAPTSDGRRQGWWGLPAAVEAFLDQLITWRELGFNTCVALPRHQHYDSLPGWARATLEQHEDDPRPQRYSRAQLEQARTHDPLWNAAQRQLVREGRIHNYLRMLWGKKILGWTRRPRQALSIMTELNDRYALDGRDPNSESGIFWILGRYDRPWGPERPIFGKVRYMSSQSARRKLKLKSYLDRFGD